MSTYEMLTVVFAALSAFSSLVTAVSVALALCSYFKNSFSKRTFRVYFERTPASSADPFNPLFIQNFTNKDFTFIDCYFLLNGKRHPLEVRLNQADGLFLTDPTNSQKANMRRSLRDLHIAAYTSMTFNTVIYSLPDPCPPQKLRLVAETTIGRISFPVHQ